jgi:hypothetical protein
MYRDVLIPTDVGLQAMLNADAGGVLIDATGFKLGSSSLTPKKTDVTDILGATLFSGQLHRVEVLSENVARFAFEVPGYLVETDTVINEVGIYLSSFIMLGRCVFETPITLIANETTHFNCLLVTSRCNLTMLNVTVGDHSSIPSTPTFNTLQSPHESFFNVVSVLQGKHNADGSMSPVMAMKYSGGGFQWAFTDHNRVFFGHPTAANPTHLAVPGLNFDDGDRLIIHVVSGAGVGNTRLASVANEAITFESIPGLSSSSTVAVWQRIGGPAVTTSCTYPPNVTNIPSDWVLTRGVSGCPIWAPVKNQSATLSTLYTRPSRLEINSVTYSGTGDTAKFALGSTRVENPNYLQPALGGVTQHKSAFDVSGNEMTFVEVIDPGIPVELRMFSRVPSSGSRLNITIDRAVGDGVTQNYPISQPVTNANYIKVFLRGTRQMISTYTYDPDTQSITMLSPIPAGIGIEIRSYRNISLEGYSTQIFTYAFSAVEDTFFFELPVQPQSVEYVEISQSGSVVHSDLYALVDNRVILSGPIKSGLDVEVTIYDSRQAQGSEDTNLQGVVTDAILTGRNLLLLRHDAHPVKLPIPAVSFESGPGIKITGKHPFYRIESTLTEQLMDVDANFKISDTRVQKDATEVLYTKRIKITSDLMVVVHADFQSKLGPGFITEGGLEIMEYVVGFRTSTSREPDYGRNVSGTSVAGFSNLSDQNDSAYSNASMTQVYDIKKKNHPSGYIDVVVKMRVKNARIGLYGAILSSNINIIGTARL